MAASEAVGGPYPPSGWRPDGLTLQLPQRQIQPSSQQERYIPPAPAQAVRPEYGAPSSARTPATDLTVQGLPATEQTPLFTETPLSGQQYVGRQFNEDLRQLLEEQRRLQAEKQRFANPGSQPNSFGSGQSGTEGDCNHFSSQTPSANKNTAFGSPQDTPLQSNTYSRIATSNNPQRNINSGFGSQTSSTTGFGNPNQYQPSNPTQRTTPRETEVSRTGTHFRTTSPPTPQEEGETTTENDDTKDSVQPQPKVSFEISQQMLRQLPENYPNQLVQLALQQQYPSVPFTQQIGQLQAPVFYQPLQGYSQNLISQPQTVGIQSFDPRNPSNFAAYDATISQRQVTLPQSFGQQGFYPTGQLSEQYPQTQIAEIQPQYQQAFQVPGQQAALNPYNVATSLDFQRLIQAPRQDSYPENQIFQQNLLMQTRTSQNTPVINPRDAAQVQVQDNQPDVYQSQNQPGFPQTQIQGSQNVPSSNQQPRFPQQPSLFQNGFDSNQRGNGLDSSKPEDEEQDGDNDEDVADVPAVGFPRFGERLPPGPKAAVPQRPYGPPSWPSGVDARPSATTDAPRENDEDNTGGEGGEGETVAVATAVADGRKRKSRLRNIRPLFTLDRNGDLVQLQ